MARNPFQVPRPENDLASRIRRRYSPGTMLLSTRGSPQPRHASLLREGAQPPGQPALPELYTSELDAPPVVPEAPRRDEIVASISSESRPLDEPEPAMRDRPEPASRAPFPFTVSQVRAALEQPRGPAALSELDSFQPVAAPPPRPRVPREIEPGAPRLRRARIEEPATTPGTEPQEMAETQQSEPEPSQQPPRAAAPPESPISAAAEKAPDLQRTPTEQPQAAALPGEPAEENEMASSSPGPNGIVPVQEQAEAAEDAPQGIGEAAPSAATDQPSLQGQPPPLPEEPEPTVNAPGGQLDAARPEPSTSAVEKRVVWTDDTPVEDQTALTMRREMPDHSPSQQPVTEPTVASSPPQAAQPSIAPPSEEPSERATLTMAPETSPEAGGPPSPPVEQKSAISAIDGRPEPVASVFAEDAVPERQTDAAQPARSEVGRTTAAIDERPTPSPTAATPASEPSEPSEADEPADTHDDLGARYRAALETYRRRRAAEQAERTSLATQASPTAQTISDTAQPPSSAEHIQRNTRFTQSLSGSERDVYTEYSIPKSPQPSPPSAERPAAPLEPAHFERQTDRGIATPSRESAALRAVPEPPAEIGVIQRTVEQETSQQESGGQGAPTTESQQEQPIDINRLAEQVYQRLRRRIEVEAERLGWPSRR